MHPNESAHRAILAAFEAGDAVTAASFYTDDALFHINGRGALAGDHRGFAAFMETFAQLAGGVDSYHQEVHDIVANDRHSVGIMTAMSVRGSQSLTSELVTVLTWQDGKVIDERIIDADPHATEAFFG